MARIVLPLEESRREEALDLLERTFTLWDSPEEGRLVRSLAVEMARSPWHVPALELVMIEDESIIGYANFTRFPLEGRHADRLLLLSPVATIPEKQRTGVSRELIETGFQIARSLGYTAVLVEGDPRNYRARGFVTSADFGITAAERVGLPHPDCLMVKELIPGGSAGVTGEVDYDLYESLHGGNA